MLTEGHRNARLGVAIKPLKVKSVCQEALSVFFPPFPFRQVFTTIYAIGRIRKDNSAGRHQNPRKVSKYFLHNKIDFPSENLTTNHSSGIWRRMSMTG